VRAPVVLIGAIPGWNINPVPCVITKTTSLLRKACSMETDKFPMEYFNTAQKGASDVFRKYEGQNGIVVFLPEDHVCMASVVWLRSMESFCIRINGTSAVI
jgi:hypothetical protein